MSELPSHTARTLKTFDPSAQWTGRLCMALAVSLPALTAVSLFWGWPAALSAGAAGMGVTLMTSELAAWRQAAAAVLAMMPVLALALALQRASRCLAAFARGEHFGLAAVRALRGFSVTMLLAGLASTVVPTLLVLLLTTGGAGPARLALNFGSQHLILLLFAGITWQIAAAWAKAVVLAEEHAQIV
jgi:hypothetical protein